MRNLLVSYAYQVMFKSMRHGNDIKTNTERMKFTILATLAIVIRGVEVMHEGMGPADDINDVQQLAELQADAEADAAVDESCSPYGVAAAVTRGAGNWGGYGQGGGACRRNWCGGCGNCCRCC